MKKLALLLVAFVALYSCEQEPKVDYTLFSGKIDNPVGKNIIVLKGREAVKSIDLNDDGTFSDTLRVEPGYYAVRHGRESSSIYLNPGDNLNLTLNPEEFDESIAYTGEGSANNNYLAAKYLTDEKLSGDFTKVFAMEEADFLAKITEINDAKAKLLNDTENISEDFKALEEKNLEFEHLINIQNYPSYHAYYGKKDGFEASEEFLKPLEAVDYTNADYYKSLINYKRLVQGHYSNRISESDNPSEVFDDIVKNGSEELKTDLSRMLNYDVAPNNAHNEAYYNGLMAMSSDDEFKNKLTAKYDKVKKLAKGMPSPKFENYENHKGGTMSLEDLKGKFVYVDVWATWCGPCIREIPSLKAVESEYHDKNIEFVSVSVDRGSDYEKWMEMVNDKELGGTQLFADKTYKGGAIADINTNFIRDYAIEGIPRFILIDPEGNIVDADAPRPSNPKLRTLFDELKI